MKLKLRRKKESHCQVLQNRPTLGIDANDYRIFLAPASYKEALIDQIKNAKVRIYIVALYLENDAAGQEVVNELIKAKTQNPTLDIKIFVDWHRAQRGRIGEKTVMCNADFYYQIKCQHPTVDIPFYGVPINTREVLGVFHLKSNIIDDTISYSGASLNEVYLHQFDKYRYDRYHFVTNKSLADSMIHYLDELLNSQLAITRLDAELRPSKKEMKPSIKQFRHFLSTKHYKISQSDADNDKYIRISPIVGLGKGNEFNNLIHHLIQATQKKLVICTPYFNFPSSVAKDVIKLLRRGKSVEIIIGDKTANDFFIPTSEPFQMIGGLPYLYEVNIRRFTIKLKKYIQSGQLSIRLWKDADHTYHLKGIWVDDEWMLVTGNNLNPRAWRLDLENGILVHDPELKLAEQRNAELTAIRKHTTLIVEHHQIEQSNKYPEEVKKLLKRVKRLRVDRIIRRLL